METVKLKDVIKRANTKVDKDHTDLIYYVGGEHIDSEQIRVTKRGLIKGSTIGPMFYYGFKAGDFLLVSRNPHLKKAGVVDFDGVCSEKTFVLATSDEKRLLPQYLPFVLQNEKFWEYAYEHRHGSTNTFINWSTLADYEFELPTIEIQRNISDVLWSIIDTMDSYKELIQKTDELVKSQFIELSETAKKKRKLKDCAEVIYGYPFDSKQFNNNKIGTPLIRIRDINSGFSETYTTERAEGKYIAHKNDCIIGMDGHFEAVKWKYEDGYINQRVCKILPITIGKEFMLRFLQYTLKDFEINAQLTTVKHLSAKDIENIQVPIITDDGQRKFERFSIQSDKSKFLVLSIREDF